MIKGRTKVRIQSLLKKKKSIGAFTPKKSIKKKKSNSLGLGFRRMKAQ